MSENKLSIQRLIDIWSDRHGNRWKVSEQVYREVMRELFEDLVYNGYTRSDIESARRRVSEEMVGDRSKFGAVGLANWKKIFHRSYDKTIRAVFEGNYERPEEPIVVPLEIAVVTEEERQQDELESKKLQEEYQSSFVEEVRSDDITEEDLSYIGPEFKELDRSRFKDIQTTPVMSDEEFWATVERENNER